MSEPIRDKNGRILFTKEMKKTHTILVPMMLPIHFGMIKNVLLHEGYHVELLQNQGPDVVQTGLKYVHNDTCYPALLVIGQLINALDSGKYDLDHTALIITQTGGGCRASNYIHLLRKALVKAGYENVPVISLNLSGLERNSGFHITIPMIRKMVAGAVYGDLLMLLSNQTRPYEVVAGETDTLVWQWVDRLSAQLNQGKGYNMKALTQNLDAIAADFSQIMLNRVPKVKVGVVGEIYVKYSALGNNHLEEFLQSQDCEVMVPGLLGFVLFKTDNRLEDHKLYGTGFWKSKVCGILMNYLTKMENALRQAVLKYPQFVCPTPYAHMKTLVKDMIGYGNKMGEGWLLTAEMMELLEQGYKNIVCTQPFGCLPNHICGKGMINQIKLHDPQANIVPIDYDPSATKVNQENRIKLMLAVAREELAAQQEQANPSAQVTESQRETVSVG